MLFYLLLQRGRQAYRQSEDILCSKATACWSIAKFERNSGINSGARMRRTAMQSQGWRFIAACVGTSNAPTGRLSINRIPQAASVRLSSTLTYSTRHTYLRPCPILLDIPVFDPYLFHLIYLSSTLKNKIIQET